MKGESLNLQKGKKNSMNIFYCMCEFAFDSLLLKYKSSNLPIEWQHNVHNTSHVFVLIIQSYVYLFYSKNNTLFLNYK